MTSHCHALVLLFCADMSRMQLTRRADSPSHTHPTPACIGTSVVRIVYTCHPPALHATESPLSQALDPPHLGAVAGRFRHFSWLTLGARGSRESPSTSHTIRVPPLPRPWHQACLCLFAWRRAASAPEGEPTPSGTCRPCKQTWPAAARRRRLSGRLTA